MDSSTTARFVMFFLHLSVAAVVLKSAAAAEEIQQTPMKDGRRIFKFFNPIYWLPPFYFQIGNKQQPPYPYPRPPAYPPDMYYGYGQGGDWIDGRGEGGKSKEKEKKPKAPEPEPEPPKAMAPPETPPVMNYYSVQNYNSYYSSNSGGCGCEYKRHCDCDYDEYEYVE